MKKVLSVLFVFAMIVGIANISIANDQAPIALTDAQMSQIVAGEISFPGNAHQSYASVLKGSVAGLMPAHALGLDAGEDQVTGNVHQSGASALKGGVADLVPDHVRRN